MADKNLDVEIVTPERVVFREPVDFVVVPGIEGYLGILPMHAPIVSGLNIGVLKVINKGKETKLAISGGFMEVNKDKVVILADTAESSDEIDVERAKAARERAQNRLANRTHDIDVIRAEMALRRALTRLKAVGRE
ncbi:MAG: F0F1 ATP synthase subunit epsilon [Firmicutes bacterium HGW-Firmicutes-14]|nr:MAG: F0F1 ATP synthase subunit epsilon [Firmicutes bacterium HGW-Firmicutes-14]